MSSQQRSLSRNAFQGILWMLVAVLLSSFAGGIVRQLSGAFTSVEMVFFRNLVVLVLLAPWIMHKGFGFIRTTRIGLHSLRVLFAFLAMLLSFFALARIPIADVYALLFTIPLFTIMLAVLVLGQRAGVKTWIACAAGLCGALIIVRPGFIEISLAALAAIVSAMMSGGSNTTIKLLSRTDSPALITIYANLLMLPMALVPSLFFWVTPSWDQVPWLIGLGVTSGAGGYCFARSVSEADARVVQPFQFMRMPFATAIGFVMFAELPGVWTWVGAVVIFASTSYVIQTEGKHRDKARAGRPPADGQ